MKRNLLLIAFGVLLSLSLNAQCPVTLQLDDSANKAVLQASFKGSYNGWATTVPGYDDGTNGDAVAGDHIWSLVVDAAPSASFEWGAVNENDQWLLIGNNPSFTTDAACGVTGQTIYVIPAVKTKVDVTLTVIDPNNDYGSISIKGAYNGWSSEVAYDDGTNGDAVAGDHVWTRVVQAEVDGAYEWGAERTDCGGGSWIIQGPNKKFSLDAGGAVSGETSYSSPLQGTKYNVIFRVDMSNEIVNSTGVHVAGNFQKCAWTKNVLKMEPDPNHAGVYTITTQIAAGKYAYKYFNGDGGDDFAEANSNSPDPLVFVTDSCGEANGIGQSNRTLDLTGLSKDTVLNAYFFESCDASLVKTKDLNVLNGVSFSPNPFSQSTLVKFENANNDVFSITLSSVTGANVYNVEGIQGNSYLLDKADLKSGLYFATLKNQKGEFVTKKLVIE